MKDEPQLTPQQAVEKMREALGIAATRDQVLSVAAYGLVWRNERIRHLEQMVVKLGGWPWKKGRPVRRKAK